MNAPVEIVEASTPHLRRQFIRMTYDLYRDDPSWVAPLEYERQRFIDPGIHPFYQHGSARAWLAISSGRVVGRVLVSDDPHYNHRHGTSIGCFGMFESTNDPRVAHALLNQASQWLKERGRQQIMGPIDYSTNYSCGLLIDGFDTPPRVMMNHGRPYYAPLLEGWGLEKVKDLNCWWFPRELNLDQKWSRIADRLQKRSGFTIRAANQRDFWNEVQRLKRVFELAFADKWGFVAMSDAEFQYMASELRPFVVAGLMLFAEHQGEVVGVSLTLPDLNEAIRPLKGRLTRFGIPINLLRLFYNYRRVKVGRLLLIGVDPKFRRRGILERLILETFNYGVNQAGFSAAELGWTLEDNDEINGPIAATGAKKYKTYRIYCKSLINSQV